MAKSVKEATISSLIRMAAVSEPEFIRVVQEVLDAGDLERTAEFFDKLNIPRSVPCEEHLIPLTDIKVNPDLIGDFAIEHAISCGIQRFMERHDRKIKWHAGHPSLEGGKNVFLVVRCALMITDVRLERLHLVMNRKDELTPVEWFQAREMMNSSFLAFRNMLNLLSGIWVDAITLTVSKEELDEFVANFHVFIDAKLTVLESYREKLESRRTQLTVCPEGYPPVKPPKYFSGDLFERGPWTQYWAQVDTKAHAFRSWIS